MRISRYPRGLVDVNKMVKVEDRDLIVEIRPWTDEIAFIDLNVTMERSAERQSQVAISLTEMEVVALYEALIIGRSKLGKRLVERAGAMEHTIDRLHGIARVAKAGQSDAERIAEIGDEIESLRRNLATGDT
ncbi:MULTISPECIES: hypothetical protein [Paraburkholderia]|uniref:Uncharacterized protein n=1 Tax=Paraburkholderia madseniana TaxID=2599607 RepID=A0AAP5F1P3_9BURK|nr:MULTISPECIES: hypothetical protein [Paraburkholderia]MCX4151747.1 hypothetical protein [Paraburkholderia madseniana]MDN7154674.1 hypothetical protein [Paraburkholderia sp. WS6]MDQ6413557.1 hypothetical protein [Paraburkholderia madseniana]